MDDRLDRTFRVAIEAVGDASLVLSLLIQMRHHSYREVIRQLVDAPPSALHLMAATFAITSSQAPYDAANDNLRT